MTGRDILYDGVPKWVLVIGPFVVLGTTLAVLLVYSPLGNLHGLEAASTWEIVRKMAMIGLIVGIIPVVIGMLWFPFLRTLESRWIHIVLALSAGVLTFVGVEMTREAVTYVRESPSVELAGSLAIVAFVATFVAMVWISKWSHSKVSAEHSRGLGVAYLIALGLGLHSLGEGIAIGSALLLDESRLAILLIVGFLLDNVTEGPTIVAAVARDEESPPLLHFAALGLIAGGPVVLGGWIAAVAFSPLLAAALLAVGIGAITQVIWELVDLIRFDAGRIVDRSIMSGFAGGFLFMVVLDEIFIDLVLLG